MGQKRAAYHIYCPQPLPAPKALEFGIINDVLPREELLPKAWDLARFIMKRPRYTRWAAHNILSRHWKTMIAEDFGFPYGSPEAGECGEQGACTRSRIADRALQAVPNWNTDLRAQAISATIPEKPDLLVTMNQDVQS